MKNILVVGANGMLGCDLVKVFEEKKYRVSSATRKDFDVTKIEEVKDFFREKTYDLVINTVAYTQVDKSEDEREQSFLINEFGARNLAYITSQSNIPIIYISTDYVFSGEGTKLYKINDETSPINVYGESKLAGEITTRNFNPRSYIVRTSWLYGKNGTNFVDTMLELSESRSEISIVDDQFSCPTWTVELASAIEKLFREDNQFGTYHLCGSGVISWYKFAKEIFKIKKVDIKVLPVSTDAFPRAAKRPKFSAMDNNGLLRYWKKSLNEYLS